MTIGEIYRCIPSSTPHRIYYLTAFDEGHGWRSLYGENQDRVGLGIYLNEYQSIPDIVNYRLVGSHPTLISDIFVESAK